MKFRFGEGHQGRQMEPGGGVDEAKVERLKAAPEYGADDKTDQHRRVFHDAGGKGVNIENNHQRDCRHQQREGGAKAAHFAAPAANPPACHRHNRHADKRDDAAHHHLGKEADELANPRRAAEDKNTGHDHRPGNTADPVLLTDQHHRDQRGEGTALDKRQPTAEPLTDPQRLHDGGRAADKQVGADQ